MSQIPRADGITQTLAGESATVDFGRQLAPLLASLLAAPGMAGAHGCTIYLEGELGAGKTTLVRGVLRGLGFDGAVKSPTFTLVEPYEFRDFAVYHFDLYRIGDPDELEYLGLGDYFRGGSVCLIEWPARGHPVLPASDLHIELTVTPDNGRQVTVTADAEKGGTVLRELGRR